MVKITKELRAEINKVRDVRHNTYKKILEMDKSNKLKDETVLKSLIKLCKEYDGYTTYLKDYGFNARIEQDRLDYKYWETQLKNKTDIVRVVKPKSTKKSIEKTPITNPTEEIYFIMLCWTMKPEFCICESIIEKIQNYMKVMNINSVDITKTEFPDRVEFCEMYKLKCSKEHYEVILKSVNYILEISTDSVYDKCNIGIFGKEG